MKRLWIILASAAIVLALVWFVPHSLLKVTVENPARAASAGNESLATPLKERSTSVPTTATPSTAVSQSTPTGVSTAWENLPPGWQIFKHATLGYSLTYPLIWVNNQVSWYSQEFNEIQQEPAGMGPPLRLYVSVYPKDYTNQSTDADHFVYHFIPIETIREFMALQVGQSKVKDADTPTPDADIYTRLPDRVVAGETALVIENSTVWEAPAGTKDRMIIFATQDTSYILGMYYETPEQLAMFEQVLDSFQAKSPIESTPTSYLSKNGTKATKPSS